MGREARLRERDRALSKVITHITDVRPETGRAVLVRLDLDGAAFPFVAGQAVLAGLAERPDRKPYSLACAPHQARETGCLELLVQIDAKGRAGRHLASLDRGAAVEVNGPTGSFTLEGRHAERRLLFVAGGTGIAPLRAMLWDALGWDAVPEIDLLYSARTPDDFAFISELRRLHTDGRIRLRQTATRGAGPDWSGSRRRIDRDLLASVVVPGTTLCLVCGPDSLVEDVPAMLGDLGVPPARVRREEY